ncbi:Rrf2 family transcriptional regulator [Micromonospora sonneratiae]|uniref:RrF2 family transcriptional regulator n=1 Tax=Micromonospora sonneratiae TaxID=1184706 RepID=A0ABW3YHN6_9ACTN
MYVSARSDYAVRAMLAIAAGQGGEPIRAAALASEQEIPLSFLHDILLDLRRAGLLHSRRGLEGGYSLTRPAVEVTVGEVLRAVSGSLTTVRGQPAEATAYRGVASGLRDVWLAVHSAIEGVVDQVTLTDLLLPDQLG